MRAETDLYEPVKAFLEAQGYSVKGEVRGCDVVGVRGAEPPVVVELKRNFSLALVLQGIDRLALTDRVYWPSASGPAGCASGATCVGVSVVACWWVTRGSEVVLDPLPYAPRRATRRTAMLLGEHARRVGTPPRRLVHPVRGSRRIARKRCGAPICWRLVAP